MDVISALQNHPAVHSWQLSETTNGWGVRLLTHKDFDLGNTWTVVEHGPVSDEDTFAAMIERALGRLPGDGGTA